MTLDLVSRTYNGGANNWTIVAEATLSSNRVCLPIAFNCIVGQLTKPSNASLIQLRCQSPAWNHLLVFRDHCLRQTFFAGHQQEFQFTYTTDPGVGTGSVDLAVEFGRGFLPVEFQQLATATLTVSLDATLEVSKVCPAEVESAATVNCTVTVRNPSSGPATTVSLVDSPDGTLITGGTLTETGTSAWTCGSLTCTIGSLAAGTTTTFSYVGTAATTATGGDGSNTAALTWNSGTASAVDPIVVVGNGDTRLEIEKVTSQSEATPGQPITWTIILTNAGPLAATDPVVTDTPPVGVNGLTLTYVSGMGTWNCSGVSCTAATMPVGTTTFTATGTVAADAPTDRALVNEVGVAWANDILGPDFPITAGSAVPVVASATTTSTPAGSDPANSGGTPLSVVG